MGVLAPPPPDRERRGQQFRPPSLDIFEKSGRERAQFWIFAAGVKLAENEPAG
jgi:hypothetical protein